MKIRLEEVEATHGKSSHVSPSIISIHVIAVVIRSGGARGNGGSPGVSIAMIHHGLLPGMVLTQGWNCECGRMSSARVRGRDRDRGCVSMAGSTKRAERTRGSQGGHQGDIVRVGGW